MDFVAAYVSQAVRIDFRIWKEVILARHNRRIRLIFARQDRAASFEIDDMENHQHTHADPFEQEDYDFCQEADERRPYLLIRASVILVKYEPSNIGEGKEDGNNGVSAPFSPHRVHHFAPGSSFSVHSSLRLHKQPDHQQEHRDDLAHEAPANYV